MKIKEAFIAFLGFDADADQVNLALLNANLNGDDNYSVAMKGKVESSIIDLLFNCITTISESESQYSTSKDADLMKQRLLYLARKYNRRDIINTLSKVATVKNISRIR